jgi:glutaredoxin
MPSYELFGASGCPHTQEMREWLEWRGIEFLEHDVETDPSAFDGMKSLTKGQRTVPVLVEDGKVVQIGWQGRGCVVGAS